MYPLQKVIALSTMRIHKTFLLALLLALIIVSSQTKYNHLNNDYKVFIIYQIYYFISITIEDIW